MPATPISYVSMAEDGLMIAPLTSAGAVPAAITITAVGLAAVVYPVGSTSIALFASTEVTLPVDSVLAIGRPAPGSNRTMVRTTAAATIPTATTGVVVPIRPLSAQIVGTARDSFHYTDSVPLGGMTDAPFQVQDITADATGTDAGNGTFTAKVRNGLSGTVSFIDRPNDPGAILLKTAGASSVPIIQHVQFRRIYGDAEVIQGTALVGALNRPSPVSGIKTISFTLTVQGTPTVLAPVVP